MLEKFHYNTSLRSQDSVNEINSINVLINNLIFASSKWKSYSQILQIGTGTMQNNQYIKDLKILKAHISEVDF